MGIIFKTLPIATPLQAQGFSDLGEFLKKRGIPNKFLPSLKGQIEGQRGIIIVQALPRLGIGHDLPGRRAALRV